MSPIRSILLHLDASARSARRLALAHDVAALHDAQVTALYATTPMAFSQPLALAEGAVELLPVLEQLDRDHRRNARALFDRGEATSTRPFVWRELGNVPLIAGVAGRALCTDLIILGQHDPSDPLTAGVPADFIPSLLLACGRPALVVPYVDICTTFAEQVLIAWKPTRQSAHALTASLAFLRQARRIHLAVAADDGAIENPAAALEAYLRLHGVQAPVRHHAPVPSEAPGEGLLSLAADAGADLLVMGCYGHSRARELLLGGASRTLLASMTLPVLMAH